MNVLRALTEGEAGRLAEFRESGRTALMIRLVHTECLLELAQLVSADADMASYADTAVEVMEQLLPIQGCSLSIEVDGVPPIRAQRGRPGAGVAVSAPLSMGEHGRGQVAMSVEIPELGPPEFVEAVAEQISAALKMVVETERLRRQAALADTTRLVAALGDDPSGEALESLVAAFSYLPNVVGVSMEIVHPVVGGTVLLNSGLKPEGEWISRSVDGGFIRSAIAWAGEARAADVDVVCDLLDRIGVALTRAEDRRRLLDDAQTDPLTGVANRRRAMQALDMAMALARLNDGILAVAYLDLDRFKVVNDRFGHAAGDDVLVRFAAHLRSSVRRSDTVARMGGEEFLLICPGLDERPGRRLLQAIVDRTPDACAGPLSPEWRQTTSVGLAIHPYAGADPETLLRRADQALYSVKHMGGNGVGCAAPLS